MRKGIFILLFLLVLSCDNSKNQRDIDYKLSVEKVELLDGINNENKQINVVDMQEERGVRYVWVEVNGIRLHFIFDTGASNISISSAEATVLYRQGTLSREDILDIEYFQDATGNISEGTSINLREIKIGNKTITNVKATIVDNINAPLLLGQSVLERFGKIEIDYDNNQIIFK